jgi:hypothetical protein
LHVSQRGYLIIANRGPQRYCCFNHRLPQCRRPEVPEVDQGRRQPHIGLLGRYENIRIKEIPIPPESDADTQWTSSLLIGLIDDYFDAICACAGLAFGVPN